MRSEPPTGWPSRSGHRCRTGLIVTVMAVALTDSSTSAGLLDPEPLDWVRRHHERVGGEGYPDRLHDAQISGGAAILAAAHGTQ